MKKLYTKQLFGAASVAVLLAASGVSPVYAQEASEAATTSEQSNGKDASQDANTENDPVLVTVNDFEIRQSDLVNTISALPPRMQQLPQEMLVGLAVDQLVARQLILDEARAQNMAEDPDVITLVEPSIERLTEQAMVQVWIERELEEAITEVRLEQAFEDFQAANPDSEITFEQARPQLVQALRQEALAVVTDQLRADANVVFYDASGNPTSAPDANKQGSEETSTDEEAKQ